MVFKLVKLDDGFMIGKLHTLRPSLKMTLPYHASKPLDITSCGITLIFWRRAKPTTIAKSERPYLIKNLNHKGNGNGNENVAKQKVS